MNKTNDFLYKVNGFNYVVHVTYKKGMRRILFKFDGEAFNVSCPPFTLLSNISRGLTEYGPDLIKKSTNYYSQINPYGVYVLGDFVPFKDGFIKVLGKSFLFIDKDNYYKQVKKIFLPVLEKRLRHYEKKMGIPKPYKFDMAYKKSNYGSNSSRLFKISLNTIMTHFSYEIIDSVIIHELAHFYVRDHSKKFYDIVYKFCPNYDELDRKLKKRIFK